MRSCNVILGLILVGVNEFTNCIFLGKSRDFKGAAGHCNKSRLRFLGGVSNTVAFNNVNLVPWRNYRLAVHIMDSSGTTGKESIL